MPNALDRAYSEVSNRLGSYDDEGHDYPVPDLPITDIWNGLDEIESDDLLRPVDVRFPITHPELKSETWQVIDGGIREIGMEALAFYKSFRYAALAPFSGHWGIFYLEPGIKRVQELIKLYEPNLPDPCGMAIEFLRQHERLHFKFDVYALGLEAALSKHLYKPLKQAFRSHAVYQVEEGLANHEAWRWARALKQRPGIKTFAEEFMSLQPGGYGRFHESREVLTSELAANLIDLNLAVGARRDDLVLWVANLPVTMSRWQSYCPEYGVAGALLTRWINPAWKLPIVKIIRDGKTVRREIDGRHADKRDKWENTKAKLIEESGIPGLEFKRWKNTDEWSVRVDENFRAHLLPIDFSNGVWEAHKFGPHKAMGHG